MIIYSYRKRVLRFWEEGMADNKIDMGVSHRKLSIDELEDLAELFKAFADSTRIRILYDLLYSEKNVTEITDDLEMNQSAISHQLKHLKNSKLIKARKEGQSVYYSLDDDHVKTIIAMGVEHIDE